MPQKVIVVAAHADDEALGCGGTMLAHQRQGDEVSVLFFTDGVRSRDCAGEKEAEDRTRSMNQAMEILGVSQFRRLEFPDNAIDTVSLLAVTKAVEQCTADWGLPDLVYTHHPMDLNIDHRIAYNAVMTCFRPQPANRGCPRAILTFEVLSSTGWIGGTGSEAFVPNYFVDISSTLDAKLDALKAYSDELRPWPHARSLEAVEHLARLRGASVGLEAAEAFRVERIIQTGIFK
jgi:LmbE family N-acetylglucosaminyl deacetylase